MTAPPLSSIAPIAESARGDFDLDERGDDRNFYAEYRRLAAEQATLTRLVTLMTRGVKLEEVYRAVATEMRGGLPAHRDEHIRQLLEQSRRADLIDALLEGRVDQWRLSEVAAYLRLPVTGRFVVMAADAPADGAEPLPEMASKLRSLDVHSAWHLLSDVQVGVVHVRSQQKLDTVVALVSRTTDARVGVSAPFDDLRDTPGALHVARVMLRGPVDSTSSVAVFDGSLLATAAVSAPEALIKGVSAALDGFSTLPDHEREQLFQTFRVWCDTDASADDAAKVLVCHPNTVRNRLRRIEKCSGRSLSRPKDIAELSLMLEVHRLLMWSKPSLYRRP